MFEINSKFKSEISSKSFNDKIDNLVGGNMIVSGFDVTKQGATSMNVPKGTCVIGGAFITETTTSQVINIPENLTSKAKIHLVIKYQHESQSVEYDVVETIPSNAVIVATIDMASGAISNITLPEKMRKLKELNKALNEVDTTFEEIEGSFVTVKNSKPGLITELEFLGNTVQNPSGLSDIKSCGNDNGDGTFSFSAVSSSISFVVGGFGNGLDIAYNPNTTSINRIRTEELINVSPGDTYKIRCSDGYQLSLGLYNSSYVIKQVIGWSTVNEISITLNSDIVKMGILIRKVGSPNLSGNDLKEICVRVEGKGINQSTANFNLPVQLEKVGDIADKLYYDGDEEAWCICKGIFTEVLNGSENDWGAYVNQSQTNTTAFRVLRSGHKITWNSGTMICNNFESRNKQIYTEDIEGISSDATSFIFRILKSKLETPDVSGFKKWLQANNTLVKYGMEAPQKIILPATTQAQLSSFLDTTHVYFADTEIEGTIKGKIPKSLAASAQSNAEALEVLDADITSLENLRESCNTSYNTDKGYINCKNTINGYVGDVSVAGNSLVNLCKIYDFSNNFITYSDNIISVKVPKDMDYINLYSKTIDNIKPNTLYTIKYEFIEKPSSHSGDIRVDVGYGSSEGISYTKDLKQLIKNIDTFTTDDMASNKGINIRIPYNAKAGTYKFNILILEGDHTANPPEYFEGLLSVGDDVDCMEIKSNNTNLFDGNYLIGNYNATSGVFQPDTSLRSTPLLSINGFSELNKNSSNRSEWYFYDRDKNYLGKQTGTTRVVPPNNSSYVSLYYTNLSITENGDIDKIMINYGTQSMPYKQHKSNKKNILYKDNLTGELIPIPVLRGINDTVKDYIQKHSDGKYYYHKRCEEVVLDGSEEWVKYSSSFDKDDNITFFGKNIAVDGLYDIAKASYINDRFASLNPTQGTSSSGECLFLYNEKSPVFKSVAIKVLKTKAPDLNTFKTWLQENPTTVIYELAKEEVYEMPDLKLDSYNDETLVSLNSGAIPATLGFDITSHISNVVSEIKSQAKENSKDLDNLLRSKTIKVEANNGYEVIEDTKEGIISDFRVEGRSLVNLAQGVKQKYEHGPGDNSKATANLKLGFTYTLCCKIRTIGSAVNGQICRIVYEDGKYIEAGADSSYLENHQGVMINTFVMSKPIKSNGHNIQIGWLRNENAETNRLIIEDFMILEGDHTANPPSYFEGILSTGQDTDGMKLVSTNAGKINTNPLHYYNTAGDVVPVPALRSINNMVKDYIQKHSDGKYYYHKACEEAVLDGSEEWTTFGSNVFSTPLDNPYTIQSKLICDKYKEVASVWQADIATNGAKIHSSGKLYIKDMDCVSFDLFKTKIQSSNVTVIYQLAKEEVYEMVDINLESYDGETIINLEAGTIDGKFSCRIDNNLGDVISHTKEQAKKNTEDLDSLLRNRTLKIKTDKDYEVVEGTEDGQIDNMKLEGRTLVNLAGGKLKIANDSVITPLIQNGGTILKPNIKYTCIILDNNKKVNVFKICSNDAQEMWLSSTFNKIATFTTPKIFSKDINVFTYSAPGVDLNELDVDFIILEGDHTQNPPAFFEGLKSVGDGVDEIEVMSNNNNLFDEQLIAPRLEDDGYYHFRASGNTNSSFFFGFINAQGQFIGKGSAPNHVEDFTKVSLDNHKVVIGLNGNSYDDKFVSSTKNIGNLNYEFFKGAVFERIDHNHYRAKNIELAIDNKHNEYKPHRSHRKPLLYKNSTGELLPIPALRAVDNVKDTVEKHSDGKWYWHKRCEEIVFDGSKRFSYDSSLDLIKRYRIGLDTVEGLVACDKFVSVLEWGGVFEHTYTSSNKFLWIFSKQDDLNTWLQANPTTVVYQLAQEEVYECAPLYLDSYDGETAVICSSGPIYPASMEFSIHSDIYRNIEILKNRVKQLEERAFKSDRVSLRSLYRGESAKFGIEIVPNLSRNFAELDYDVYNLIKKNIEYGKSCYDKSFVEQAINFYFMNFCISFEMYQELNDMISSQYGELDNPVEPVE